MRAICVLLIFSCTCFALPIHAQECCEFNQPCRSGWSGICCDGSTVGAVILGAGAGALAGWAASSGRGRDHCTIRHQYELDECQTLDLVYSLYLSEEALDRAVALPAAVVKEGLIITPFATLPNNEIILGKTQRFETKFPIEIGSLHIPEVFFGKYQFGILINYEDVGPPESFVTLTLKVEVNSSRYGTAYATADFTNVDNLLEKDAIQQLVADYTYYPAK